MAFHKPTRKENILLGGEFEYIGTLPIVEDFESFIYKTCCALSDYDEKTLAQYGIVSDSNINGPRNYLSYQLRDDGVLYMISCHSGEYYNAIQYGETPEMSVLRGFSGGVISGCYRSMGFDSHDSRYSTERSFSFEGNEVRGSGLEKYIEGVVLEENRRFFYDESVGRYKSNFSSGENDLVPKSMTTYKSFDEARDEMGLKIESFKIAWTRKLDLLKGKGPLKNRLHM